MTTEEITPEEWAQFRRDINSLIRAGQWAKVRKRIKQTPYLLRFGLWKVYEVLREKHGILLTVLKFIAGNIGALIAVGILLYYAYIWYPYIGVIYYIVELINGYHREEFLYGYVLPWVLYAVVIGIIFMVLYFTIWDFVFPKLYIVKRDGEKLHIGRTYFYSPVTQIAYTNMDTFLNIFRPIKSLKQITVANPQAIRRSVSGELLVHAEGIVHLHDDEYAFTDEYVPQQDIYRDVIERHADEMQSYTEYRVSRSLRYNPEINKTKYKSTIILLPAAVFRKEYHAPEESYKGTLENLRNRIEVWERINEEALTDEDLQADLSQKLAPLLKEIYEYSRALEEYIPELKEKNDHFMDEMNEHNVILGKEYFDENLNTKQIPLDIAKDYVANVRAVLEGAEYAGVIEE